MTMKKSLLLSAMIAMALPTIASASMSVIKDHSGKVVAVDPWSYLDEDVMWTTTRSSNNAGGKVHGQIKMKYAIEDNNWKDSSFNNGSSTFTFAQGVFRHDSLPGWYLGMSNGRTTNYNGTWDNQEFNDLEQWTQLVIGHEAFYEDLRYGVEVMGGSATKDNFWQGRAKLYLDWQIGGGLSFFSYAYSHIDHRRNASDNDQDKYSFKVEPGLQYIINNTTGVWVRQQFAGATLDRVEFGDVKEKSTTTSLGIWHNWGKLSTTLSGGFSHYRKFNASYESNEVFQETRERFMKLTANYPITQRFTLSGELTGALIEQQGLWVTNGEAVNTECKVMIDYNF